MEGTKMVSDNNAGTLDAKKNEANLTPQSHKKFDEMANDSCKNDNLEVIAVYIQQPESKSICSKTEADIVYRYLSLNLWMFLII